MADKKRVVLDQRTAAQVASVLTQLCSLLVLLENDGRHGEVQRAALTSDIRTKRNLRHLIRRCRMMAEKVDPLDNRDPRDAR